MISRHQGSCHCGAIKATFASSLDLAQVEPRACGCTFCRKHPSAWFADPAGHIALDCAVEPRLYRLGTRTADFVLCPNCGILLAASCEIEGKHFGILNLNCLDGDFDWPTPSAKSNFDGEGTGDRLARRAKNWMPIEVTISQQQH